MSELNANEKTLPPELERDILRGQVKQLGLDNTVLRRRIQTLEAQIDAARGSTAGTLRHLADMVEGARIYFVTAAPGRVASLTEVVIGPGDKPHRLRAVIKHDDGATSFHRYRFDGRSDSDPSHDIVAIQPPEPAHADD